MQDAGRVGVRLLRAAQLPPLGARGRGRAAARSDPRAARVCGGRSEFGTQLAVGMLALHNSWTTYAGAASRGLYLPARNRNSDRSSPAKERGCAFAGGASPRRKRTGAQTRTGRPVVPAILKPRIDSTPEPADPARPRRLLGRGDRCGQRAARRIPRPRRPRNHPRSAAQRRPRDPHHRPQIGSGPSVRSCWSTALRSGGRMTRCAPTSHAGTRRRRSSRGATLLRRGQR